MSFKPFKRIGALLTLIGLMCALGSAMAAGIELSAEMGYDGACTYLRSLPVKVQVTNQGADVSGVLALDVDRDETYYDRYTMPLSIAAGATMEVTLPIRLTTKQDVFALQWLVNGEPQAQIALKPGVLLAPSTFMVGVLSQKAQNLAYLNITTSGDVLKRRENWQVVALDRDSFPTTLKDMDFFDMVVVDGMDLNDFSTEQQAALDDWLRQGGIVLLGGGAQASAAFPYFSSYSGISAGALVTQEDITSKLLALLKQSGDTHQAAPRVALEGASGIAIGEEPLIDLTRVDSGYLFTASFSLSDRPLNSWMGKNVLWQRVLLQYAQSRYSAIIQERADGGYQRIYPNSAALQSIPVPNQGAMGLPIIILVLFVGMVGFGSYFLLKRWDKREWMWLAVPCLCGLGVLAMLGVSGLLNLQAPIATSYTVLEINSNGEKSSHTAIAITSANTDRMELSLAEGSIDLEQSNPYYYEMWMEGELPTKKLRYETVLDGEGTVTFDQEKIWEEHDFLTTGVPLGNCNIEGRAYWEGENLCFQLQNTGDLPLAQGVIMTDYGYVSVPAVLPGETVKVAMEPMKGKMASRETIQSGVLLSEADSRNWSIHEFLSLFRSTQEKAEQALPQAISIMLEDYANVNDWYYGVGSPRYIGFCNELSSIRVKLNGEVVTRRGQQDMVVAELKLSAVSEDGKVRFLNGTIPILHAEVDSQGNPYLAQTSAQNSRYISYRLAEQPVFGFDLSQAPEQWTLTRMDISPRYSYYGYQVELYRVEDGEWVPFKTSEYDQNTGKSQDEYVLPELSQFVNEEGTLFARFTTYGRIENYADVDQPTLTMEGRLN